MGKMNVVISDKTEKQFRRTTPIHKGFKKREEDSLNSICLTFGIVGGELICRVWVARSNLCLS